MAYKTYTRQPSADERKRRQARRRNRQGKRIGGLVAALLSHLQTTLVDAAGRDAMYSTLIGADVVETLRLFPDHLSGLVAQDEAHGTQQAASFLSGLHFPQGAGADLAQLLLSVAAEWSRDS